MTRSRSMTGRYSTGCAGRVEASQGRSCRFCGTARP